MAVCDDLLGETKIDRRIAGKQSGPQEVYSLHGIGYLLCVQEKSYRYRKILKSREQSQEKSRFSVQDIAAVKL